MWHEDFDDDDDDDGDDDDDDDELITRRDAYIERKAQKAKIKEELMSVAWHPDRWWDWCVTEDEKKEPEICCTLCPSRS